MWEFVFSLFFFFLIARLGVYSVLVYRFRVEGGNRVNDCYDRVYECLFSCFFSGFDIIDFKYLILFISENEHNIVIFHEHQPLSLKIYTVVLSVSKTEKKLTGYSLQTECSTGNQLLKSIPGHRIRLRVAPWAVLYAVY